jgi:hypothetical protein
MAGTCWQPEPVRCPFCIQGNEFRVMVDLTGGLGGIFYCSACRHLIRRGKPDFHCLCRSCQKLEGAAASLQPAGEVPDISPSKRKRVAEQRQFGSTAAE